MTSPARPSTIGPAPPGGEAALRRRIASLRRRSDHLSTLLFCLVSCLDVIADGLVAHELAEHGPTEHALHEEARALLARIDQVKAKAASARQHLHETERLLHGPGLPGDVVWRP
ncbi:hypothetical protein CCR97_05365 [Rhodoplanes elegans]|uniref:Uncharacterized protein n=1 Tax=Rhodoplanes elegans TaxID=29408 RepID=A0A327KQV1_9BRAD|nr:hypothetical protein [Rhodoplanes elegans]MBK5957639.1 hypothetical protein [Rhodoplanes elegans]RAI41269.1 hypothetical protein CH338_03665 [Rhodoplanes elegans]